MTNIWSLVYVASFVYLHSCMCSFLTKYFKKYLCIYNTRIHEYSVIFSNGIQLKGPANTVCAAVHTLSPGQATFLEGNYNTQCQWLCHHHHHPLDRHDDNYYHSLDIRELLELVLVLYNWIYFSYRTFHLLGPGQSFARNAGSMNHIYVHIQQMFKGNMLLFTSNMFSCGLPHLIIWIRHHHITLAQPE